MKYLTSPLTQAAVSLLFTALALAASSCGDLKGSKTKSKTTLPGKSGDTTSPTNPGNSDDIVSKREDTPSAPGEVKPADVMIALLASCGSPMVDIVSGTFKLAVPGVDFSFTKSGETVTTSDGKEWIVTPTGVESQIKVTGKNAADLPAYDCGRLQADKAEDGGIRKYITVRVSPYDANVSWFARPGNPIGVVYQVTVTSAGQVVPLNLVE